MNGAIDILRRERLQAQEQLKSLRARIRDLDQAISLLDASVPGELSRGAGDLKQKVLTRLQQLHGGGETPAQIAASLTAAGRPTSDQSVSSTLSRLKSEGKVQNSGGRWFATPELTESQKEESQTSSAGDDFDDLDDIPF